MNPQTQYEKLLQFEEYIQKQKSLSESGSVSEFAKLLFEKNNNNFSKNDLLCMLLDDDLEPVDIFCIILELVLHGLDILSKGENTIFDLTDTNSCIVNTIDSYLQHIGFKIKVREEFFLENPVLYRDKNTFYCEILPMPPQQFCSKGWYVLNYRLVDNNLFVFHKNTLINHFKAFFISNSNKIYTINFEMQHQSIA